MIIFGKDYGTMTILSRNKPKKQSLILRIEYFTEDIAYHN